MSGRGGSAGKGATSHLLDDLIARIAERVPKNRVEPMTEFARAYTHRLSPDEVKGLSADELFGRVTGAFHLADARGAEPIAVRVFVPTLYPDANHTEGSVYDGITVVSSV